MILLALLAGDLLLGAAFVLDQLLREPAAQLSRWIDLDGEGTLNAWWSSAKLLVLGLVFGGFAWARRLHRDRAWWIAALVAAIFTLLSMDETLQIHEYLGYRLMPAEARRETAFGITGIWGFVFGPALAVLLFSLGWAARGYLAGRRSIAWRLAAGAVVFIAAAAGLDEVANLFPYGSAAYRFEVLFEETGEQIGVSIMLWAALDFARSHGFWAGFHPVPLPAAAAVAPIRVERAAVAAQRGR